MHSDFHPVFKFLITTFLSFLFTTQISAQDKNSSREKMMEQQMKTMQSQTSTEKLRYQQLITSISAASADKKISMAEELVEITSKTYSPKDLEYYNGFNIAAVNVIVINPRLAIKHYETAIDVYKKNYTSYVYLIDDNSIMQSITQHASAYMILGLSSAYVDALEREKDFAESLSNNARCMFYTKLADAYMAANQYQKAKDCLTKVDKILLSGEPMIEGSKKDPKWIKETRERLEPIYRDARTMDYNTAKGNFYMYQQNYDSALTYSKNSAVVLDKLEKQNLESTKISKLGKRLLPDSLKALSEENVLYQEHTKEIGGSDINLVRLEFQRGKKEEAFSLASGLLERGYYYHLDHKLDQSEKSYKEAYALCEDFKNTKSYKWATKVCQVQIDPFYLSLQCARKNFDYALPKFKSEIDTRDLSLQNDFAFFSENEKKEYFKLYSLKLNSYFSVLLSAAEQNPQYRLEILNKSLQVKGLIMEATREQEKRYQNVNDEALLRDLENIKRYREKLLAFTQLNNVSAYQASVTDSINKYNSFTNSTQKKLNEKLGVPPTIVKQIKWQDIQSRLKTSEAYVEIVKVERDYFNLDPAVSQYWAFVVAPLAQPTAILLGEGADFERNLRKYQNLVRLQQEDTTSYNRYWKKIAQGVKEKTRVFLSSEGIYHLINPLTLKNPVTGKYVLDEIELIRISTGRDLLQEKPTTFSSGKSVLIGNPNFTMKRKTSASRINTRQVSTEMVSGTRSGFAVLPGTEQEVTTITSYAKTKSKEVTVLKGDNASELNVKKIVNPELLHFATHGVFDEQTTTDSYLRSKLVLAGAGDNEPFSLSDYANYEDGLLTAFEVTQLPLANTRLVVLSACETGLGEILSGDGVWGLQRAFQVAGARNILGSLWKISDEATAFYMDSFYKSYYQGASILSSYHQAMKETRTKYPHPYFWGAFVLTGTE